MCSWISESVWTKCHHTKNRQALKHTTNQLKIYLRLISSLSPLPCLVWSWLTFCTPCRGVFAGETLKHVKARKQDLLIGCGMKSLSMGLDSLPYYQKVVGAIILNVKELEKNKSLLSTELALSFWWIVKTGSSSTKAPNTWKWTALPRNVIFYAKCVLLKYSWQ